MSGAASTGQAEGLQGSPLAKAVHLLIRGLEILIVILFSALALDVLWGVLTRYLLGGQARWSEELARLLLVWLVCFGSVLAYHHRQHLGVDVLVRSLHPAAQWPAAVAVHLAVMVVIVVVLGYGGGQLVYLRWQAGQMMPALGISKAWFYLAIPASALLLLMVNINLLLESLRRTDHHPSPDSAP